MTEKHRSEQNEGKPLDGKTLLTQPNATRFHFPASSRVRKRGAFVEIQRQGYKTQSSSLLLFTFAQHTSVPGGSAATGTSGSARLGVTVSRKVGGAVVRNHVKRLLREVYRLNPSWFSPGLDFVFVARAGAARLDFLGMRSEVEQVLKKRRRP